MITKLHSQIFSAKECGALMVEAALTITIFITLFLAFVDFSIYGYTLLSSNYAVKRAVRENALNPPAFGDTISAGADQNAAVEVITSVRKFTKVFGLQRLCLGLVDNNGNNVNDAAFAQNLHLRHSNIENGRYFWIQFRCDYHSNILPLKKEATFGITVFDFARAEPRNN